MVVGSATVMGSQVLVSGNVHGTTDVTINGRLDGRVDLSATLTVGPAAVVRADLHVVRAVVMGAVVGSIHAREVVELRAGCRVMGDIVAPQLVMEDGALFRGNVLTPDMVAARPVEHVVAPTVPQREQSRPPPMRPMPKPVSVRKTQPPPMAALVNAPPPVVVQEPPPEAVEPEELVEEKPAAPARTRKRASTPSAPSRPPAPPSPPPGQPPAPRALPGRDSGARVQVKRR
jgi:cytoskeletal protein CcmA (bactofilin family)